MGRRNLNNGIRVLVALLVVSHGELTPREDFGSEDRGDAAHSQRLSCFVESLNDLLYVRLDGVVLILHCPITKVFSRTKAP